MSEAAANEFLAKVSQEKLWKYIELKTCLVKDSEDRWKVAFLNLQLLSESTTSDKTINVDNNLLLVHKILRIRALSGLLVQITGGKQIRLSDGDSVIEASLEWIQGRHFGCSKWNNR
jgi:hypothetical protein